MKILNKSLMLAAVLTAFFVGPATALAQNNQGRGNFDPQQFRERMMQGIRDRLDVKSDDEWKVIGERVEKVMDARREVGFGGGFGPGFGRGGRRGGNNGGDQANADNQGRRGRRFGAEPSPEAEELQKAIDSNASNDELKAKLAKFRESHKEKEAKLAAAQEDLRKVLSVKQEAQAALMGLVQ